MSNHAVRNSKSVNLEYLHQQIQKSLDHGVDDTKEAITNLLKYHIDGLSKIRVTYAAKTQRYTVRFSVSDKKDGKVVAYEYGFCVYSKKSQD